MSQPPFTGSGRTAAAAAAVPTYFCHQCERTVNLTPAAELTCSRCNGNFIEELENPSPNPNPNPFSFSPFDDASPFSPFGSSSGFPLIFSRSTGGGGGGMELQNLGDLLSLFGSGPMSRPGGVSGQNSQNARNPGEFDPLMFLQNYVNRLSEDGANIQFVIENANDGGGGLSFDPFRSSLGDYYFGPGLEQLIQQLAENDPNRYGTPPAAKSAVEKLPNVKITKELLESDYSDCAVCKDSFELDEEVKQLPCKHMYHPDCILPWLELHNSCPVCRFELPTDDPDYENRSRQPSGGVGGGSGGFQGDPQTPRTPGRRFSINLQWPFPGFGGRAETSNSGSGNNNSGEANQRTGGGGGGSGDGQARQEDLD
uniref:E3 ubiquitin-protein ligase RING1-like n=1 Tax=Erigeron canadensis TaxID=72917 RepID=UPI001CB90248|nr:E3 ubiquitin-protein ligase RING1-like [Erigeron canadensis]